MSGLIRILYWNVVAVSVLALPAWAQTPGIQWQHDLETAKATAAQSGRLVLVHFWTPSCGPCMALEQTVFNQPTVAAGIHSRFVPVKLNADECPAIAHNFGITKVPTDVIITPQGNVVGQIISPATPSAYVAEVHQLANRHSQGAGSPYRQAIAGTQRPDYVNPAYANLGVAGQSRPRNPNMGLANLSMPQGRQGGPGFGNTRPEMAATSNSQQTMSNQYRGPNSPNMMASNMAPPAYQQPMAQPPQTDRYGLPIQNANSFQNSASAPPNIPANSQQFASPVANPYVGQSQPSAPRFPMNSQSVAGPTLTSGAPAVATQQQTNASTGQATAASSGAPLPPGVPPLGFEGFCPVAMRKSWQWVSGDPKWGAIHRGRTYLFSSELSRDEFLKDPDHFAPALSGIDPVLAIEQNQLISGRREHSLDYDNQFFFFSNEATLEQFRRSPDRYVDGVRQAMGLAQQQASR